MFIDSSLDFVAHKNGTFSMTYDGFYFDIPSTYNTELSFLYGGMKNYQSANRQKAFITYINSSYCSNLRDFLKLNYSYFVDNYINAANPSDADSDIGVSEAEITEETKVKNGLTQLIDFFKEFQFEPNFRFVNTLSRSLADNVDKAKSYICSYFELTDNPYKNEISAKMNSKEFNSLLTQLSAIAPTHTINNRFKLYYGSQGTGKTTIAQTETDKRCVVCNSSMLPADLMEDFTFDSGNATFKPSALWNCMEQGKPIVFDEINLLPFDSLRFLQGILDGKTEFSYKGNTVHINDGFAIIGTMNLTVNGMTYGLPEPLIDRCAEMRKFSLTPDVLLSAIC